MTCRPSIMYVSINIADKTYVPSAGDSTTLTFGAHEPNDFIRSLIEDITFIEMPEANMNAEDVVMPGEAGIKSFGTLYETDGASALSVAAATAALVAMTLY